MVRAKCLTIEVGSYRQAREDIRMTYVVIELETSVGTRIVLNIDMDTYFSLLFKLRSPDNPRKTNHPSIQILVSNSLIK